MLSTMRCMGSPRGQNSTKGELEVLAAPRERRMIGRGQIEAHQPEERRQEPLGLAEGQGEDEPDR